MNAVKPRLVRVEDLSVSAFGAAAVVSKSELYGLSLKTVDGHSIAIQAWKRKNLSVDIEVVPNGLVEQCKAEGVTLTDSAAVDVDPGIHVLLGADVASDLLVQKVVSERGESARKTRIGWVLSGKRAPQPHEQLSSTTAVAFEFCDVKTAEEKVERLWAIEDLPVEKKGCQRPAFPITKVDKIYEVGLLWRGIERPEDNCFAVRGMAEKLVEKLENHGRREEYEGVLIEEYSRLDVIEKEPEPESKGVLHASSCCYERRGHNL